MQPKLVFATVVSLFLLFFLDQRRNKTKSYRKPFNVILHLLSASCCRATTLRLTAECDVSFMLSGQAPYHYTEVDTRRTEIT